MKGLLVMVSGQQCEGNEGERGVGERTHKALAEPTVVGTLRVGNTPQFHSQPGPTLHSLDHHNFHTLLQNRGLWHMLQVDVYVHTFRELSRQPVTMRSHRL